jgi:hypothetical protein
MYILHSTSEDNVLPILQSRKLLAGKHPYIKILTSDLNHDQLFAQLIYKGIPYEKEQNPFRYYACFIIDAYVLRDQSFYAVDFASFGDTFRDGFNNTKPNYHLAIGKGKYKILPALTKLKAHINNFFKTKPRFKNASFLYSHEILFGKPISLKNYGLALVVPPSYEYLEEAKALAKKVDMKVILRGDFE